MSATLAIIGVVAYFAVSVPFAICVGKAIHRLNPSDEG